MASPATARSRRADTCLGAAALLGALAVGCGAFGAHALRDRLDPAAAAWWQTATTYLQTILWAHREELADRLEALIREKVAAARAARKEGQAQ